MRVAFLHGHLELETEHHRFVPASRADLIGRHLMDGANNIGDWFVTRATTEMLDAEYSYYIYPNSPDRAFEVVNSDCDLLILKGGNFIHRGWLEKNLPLPLLKKFRIPIVYLGAGLQAPLGAGSNLDLTREDIASLTHIHDSSASCMVRGALTAEALHAVGITNVRVLGCPTLFWSGRPSLSIRPPALARVGFTLRNTLYASSLDSRKAQFEAVARLRDRAGDVVVLLQGEEVSLQEYYMYDRWAARYAIQDQILDGLSIRKTQRRQVTRHQILNRIYQQFEDSAPRPLLEWIAGNCFFSTDVEDYVQLVKALDLVAGCRLHGNICALSHGTPAFFFVYDERVREIVELLQVPHKRLHAGDGEIPADMLDYGPFERRYAELYAAYKSFLAENGIRHRLH